MRIFFIEKTLLKNCCWLITTAIEVKIEMVGPYYSLYNDDEHTFYEKMIDIIKDKLTMIRM